MEELRIKMVPTKEGKVQVEIWCPAFADQREHLSVVDALDWVEDQLYGLDPFAAFCDDD